MLNLELLVFKIYNVDGYVDVDDVDVVKNGLMLGVWKKSKSSCVPPLLFFDFLVAKGPLFHVFGLFHVFEGLCFLLNLLRLYKLML